MAASLVGLGLLLGAGTAQAQSYPAPPTWDSAVPALPVNPPVVSPPVSQPAGALQFHREAMPPAAGNAPEIAPEVFPVAGQVPGGQKLPKSYEVMEFRSLREVPGLEVLTRLESEAALMERMRQELLKNGERIVFPDEPPLAKEPYRGRKVPGLTKTVEPAFVCHGRLLFEQPNFERGLWDFGVLGPLVSNAQFICDLVMLPYHLGTRPLQQYDCSAGKCLPGDPAPFLLYPEEFSLTGLTAEAAAVTGLWFVFP
jgi:hypothetical protein